MTLDHGAKMRVYEIAREVGIPNKDLLAKIRALGLEVNNHMSSLDADDVARIKRSLEKEKQAVAEPQQTHRLSSTVLRRRSSRADEGEGEAEPKANERAGERAPAEPRPVISLSSDRSSAERAPVAHDRAERPAVAAPVEPPPTNPTPAPAAPEAAPQRAAEPVAERPAAAAAEARPTEAQPAPAPRPVEVRVERQPERPVEARVERAPERPVERVERQPERPPERQPERPVERAAAPERPALTITPVVRRRPADEPATSAARPSGPSASPGAQASYQNNGGQPASGRPGEPSQRHDSHAQSAGSAAQRPHEASAPPAQPTTSQRATVIEVRPKSRVIVAGPQMVGRPGAEPTPPQPSSSHSSSHSSHSSPPPSTPLPPRSPVVVRSRESAATSPATASAETARSRFEQELERARARTAEREGSPRPDEPVVQVPEVEQRDPSRPAVGTVIALPPRIKITERMPVGGGTAPNVTPSGQQIRGRFAQQQKSGPGGSRNDFGKKKLPLGKKGKQTLLTTPAEHKRVIRIEDTIAVADLARSMATKAPEVLKKLWGMGMTGVNINASIDFDTAQILANEFGYEVQNVAFKEEDIFSGKTAESTSLTTRSPVVTVMGHVDHGKTSLLDSIRKARVAAGESGGITQHVAAYKVAVKGHGDIVFLDTPGHEAFTEMRARGAQATDIVVLVVAANDGVMPQTLEALAHAKDAKVTIIVAVNKVDLPDAQPERVRQQLADHGLIPEEWGGDTMYVNVSALRGEGIDRLLESIAVTAEVLELKANSDCAASGLVIEARLDRNRGPMATILVQEGTLRVGDIVVAGRTLGRVRALLDDRGEQLKEAGPSTPVEILGLDGVPEAGDSVNVADDEKVAKQVVEHRRQAWRKRELASTAKVSLENLMERINDSEGKELKIVLKADVQGSAEALRAALVKQSTEKVRVNVIAAAVGGVTESDVNLAKAGGAIIVGFHVRPAGKSSKLAEQEGVQIKLYDIIYDALDEVKAAMAGLLAPIKREVPLGKLEVRDTFAIPKVGTVGGCMVVDGKITRRAHLRIIRDAIQVYEGKIGSLRRFKEDVGEVQNGYECGVMVAGWNELKQGDIIEAYEVVEEAAKL
jgi:translation initiation factor IF-2